MSNSYGKGLDRADTAATTIVAPLVHLNGTGRKSLEGALTKAYQALLDAQVHLAETGPNERDYYPLEGRFPGGSIYREAEAAHEARHQAIADVAAQIMGLMVAVADGLSGRLTLNADGSVTK